MYVVIAIVLLMAWVTLPSNIIRKFGKRAPLSRKKALSATSIITAVFVLPSFAALVCLMIMGDGYESKPVVLLERLPGILVMGVLVFLWNLLVLTRKGNCGPDYDVFAARYKDFFASVVSEGRYSDLPRGSIQRLYTKANEKGLSTAEYISMYIPERVLTECQKLSSNGVELNIFLKLCEQHGVIRYSYINILYYEYLSRN